MNICCDSGDIPVLALPVTTLHTSSMRSASAASSLLGKTEKSWWHLGCPAAIASLCCSQCHLSQQGPSPSCPCLQSRADVVSKDGAVAGVPPAPISGVWGTAAFAPLGSPALLLWEKLMEKGQAQQLVAKNFLCFQPPPSPFFFFPLFLLQFPTPFSLLNSLLWFVPSNALVSQPL